MLSEEESGIEGEERARRKMFFIKSIVFYLYRKLIANLHISTFVLYITRTFLLNTIGKFHPAIITSRRDPNKSHTEISNSASLFYSAFSVVCSSVRTSLPYPHIVADGTIFAMSGHALGNPGRFGWTHVICMRDVRIGPEVHVS